jgi:hypothetical protein
MKGSIMPRVDAANLTLFFRARCIERMRRSADRVASIRRALDGEEVRRNRVRRVDETSPFWILYAR